MRATVVFICFIIVTLTFSSFAQERFNHFYELEKLQSKELIKGISVDASGFVWIATDEGVLRFDGNETLLFYKELPNTFTKEIFITRDGRYLLLHDSGVTEIVFQNDSIRLIPFTIGDFTLNERLNFPKSIFEDLEGNIWMGETDAIVRVNAEGLSRYHLGESFRSISYHHTFAFEEDIFGNLWIAPFKGVLLSYDKEHDRIDRLQIPYPLTEVSNIKTINGDRLIITGREGFVILKIDSDKNILEQHFYSDLDNLSTVEVIDGHVYLGTSENGLYYFQFESTENIQIEKINNVKIVDIIDFHYDKNKNELWVAGGENVGILKNMPIKTIQGAGNNRIESLTKDDQGNIYYSIGQNIFVFDRGIDAPSKELFYIDDSYFAEIFFEEGNLWVGDFFGRVYYYNLEDKSETNLLTIQNVTINQIFKDQEGNKWFTGNRNGLIKVDPTDKVQQYPALDTTQAILQAKNGIIYCVSNSPDKLLQEYNKANDGFTNIPLEIGFESIEKLLIKDALFDAEENIWLASNSGLLFIKNQNNNYSTVERKTVPGFNIDEPVRAIAFSDTKRWIANTYGLVLLEGDDAILFNKDSGLPSKIILDGGLNYLEEGKLFISTTSGLGLINESEVQVQKSPAPIINTLQVNGENIQWSADEQLEFPYKSKLEISFISLSFPGNALEYQTRIVGLENEWTTPSNNRTLSVASFSDGTYTLQIRAKESGYLWSEPLELTLTIGKPWFRKWWAIAGFIILSVLIIIASIKIHNRNLIRQKNNLRMVIEERTREIQRQKNEIIEQQDKLIRQKEELLEKNQAVYKSQQALSEADMNFLHLKEKQLHDQIEYKNKQITTHTLNIIQKNESLKELKDRLETIIKKHDKDTISELKKTIKIIDESFKLDKDWEDFKLYFEQIYTGFYSKLKLNFPEITTLELRHCALIRLNLSINECASILGISPDSVKVSRTRLRKKLKLEHSQNLADFIMGI